MVRWFRAGVAIFALATSPATAVDLDPSVSAKLDGGLRYILRAGPDAAVGDPSSPFHVAGARYGEPVLDVVMKLTDRETPPPEIDGMVIGARIGAICTARVPFGQVSQLAARPEVVRLEASTLMRPSLDQAIPISRIDETWARGYTGDGVLVGIIDTGIDFRHDDFRLPGGATRIKYLFDRSDGPSGVEYTEAQINAALTGGTGVDQVDDDGHGTHVAAIAAGNGRGGFGGTYVGAAPEANILACKAWNGTGLPTSWIIEALDWMETRADQLGLPLVVNLSLGNHFGAHDGSSLLEEAVDNVAGVNTSLGAGRVVVVAAGNDGEQPIHFTGTGSFSTTTTVSHPVAAPRTVFDYVWYEIWYSGSADVRIQGPGGFNQTFPHGTFQLVQGSPSTGSVYVDNASAGPDPVNGDKQLVVVLGTTGSAPTGSYAPADGDWTFTFSGTITAPVHGWIASMYPFEMARIADADYSHLVATPATASEAIAVGAYVGRTCWPHYPSGTWCTWQIMTGSWGAVRLDQAAPFSSPGPTRDGRLKPDVSAPGMEVMAALSQNAPTPWSGLVSPDQVHQVLQGTSMATPMVVGVVALLLDQTPAATPSEIAGALTGGATGVGRRIAGRAGPGILTVLDENFEGSTAGWSITDGGAGAGDSWGFASPYALSPGTAAMVGHATVPQNETLISPLIVLPGNLTLTLDFWHGVERPGLTNGNHTVGIRQGGSGQPFTPLYTFSAADINRFPDASWLQEMGIDLTPWAGQVVEIAWIYEGTNADSWFLDDVRITAPTGGESWNPWLGHGRVDALAALEQLTPIDLLSFTAVYTGLQVRVSWRVTEPGTSLGFVLSRATTADGPFTALHEGLLPPDVPMPIVDGGVSPGRTYYYRLTEHTLGGVETYGPVSVSTHRPGGTLVDRLMNTPNPFHPRTTIRFTLDAREGVHLAVFDLAGRRVRTLLERPLDAGVHAAEWNGRDDAGRALAPGIYFYRLRTDSADITRRMAMVR